MIPTPKPGIYHQVPFDEYLQWDAVSNSSMQPALRSMLHYRTRQPIEETPAMRLGSLTHTKQFEPSLVSERYVVMPAFENEVRRDDGSKFANPKGSTAYKELVDDWKSKQVGMEIVTQSQYDDMIGMVAALAADKRATAFLTGGDYEVSILAIDPVTGLQCKGRCDHLHLKARRIGDLKTTRDASDFETTIADRSYHRQLAFYADMIEWLGKPKIKECSIVAVENSMPYGVRSAPLDAQDLQDGRDEYREILNKIAEALKTRKWKGYDSPDVWRLPGWRRRKPATVKLKFGGREVDV